MLNETQSIRSGLASESPSSRSTPKSSWNGRQIALLAGSCALLAGGAAFSILTMNPVPFLGTLLFVMSVSGSVLASGATLSSSSEIRPANQQIIGGGKAQSEKKSGDRDLRFDPELPEQVEYNIPYDIRGKLERVRKGEEGEKPQPRKRCRDYAPNEKLPVKSAEDITKSREKEIKTTQALLETHLGKGVKFGRNSTQEEKEDAIEAWTEERRKLEAKIKYYQNIESNLAKYNSQK